MRAFVAILWHFFSPEIYFGLIFMATFVDFIYFSLDSLSLIYSVSRRNHLKIKIYHAKINQWILRFFYSHPSFASIYFGPATPTSTYGKKEKLSHNKSCGRFFTVCWDFLYRVFAFLPKEKTIFLINFPRIVSCSWIPTGKNILNRFYAWTIHNSTHWSFKCNLNYFSFIQSVHGLFCQHITYAQSYDDN